MHQSIDDFAEVVTGLEKTHAEMALAVLWFFDRTTPEVKMPSGELTRVMGDHHIASANSTRMAEAIRKTKLAAETKAGFSLKPGSRKVIHGWLPDGLEGIQPAINHADGYLPDAVWKNTRGYIEAVCKELNGCYRAAYYNAAAVMLRRLLETLIIEAYEHLKRESEIKDGNGNYFMLQDLVDRACGEKAHAGLNLGRNTKTTLKDAREIGNYAAHARRYIAHASDLTKLQGGARVTVQELVHIADLVKKM